MSSNENNKLYKELVEKKKEVSSLRAALNTINDQKESWFDKKEAASKQIRSSIKGIKKDKSKRDEFTNQIKDDKTKRTELNKEVKTKVEKIKKARSQAKDLMKKLGLKKDPSKLLELIEALELKIETEVMPFSKEKKMMKEIKDIKKKYNEAKEVSNVWETSTRLNKEINDLKTKADTVHKKIQNKAKESQTRHERLILVSKDIDELKEKEAIALVKFVEFKKKFSEINEKLKEKLGELNKVNSEVSKIKKDTVSKRKQKQNDILKTKGMDVEEKIKKRKKLTTEDLLVFQSKSR